MANSSASRTGIAIVAAIVVMGIAAYIGWRVANRPGGNDVPPPGPKGAEFFREAALESGIKFRQQFIPDEQGEKFKVNLYDHGTGVAVGDYDGDGYDDVYFVNQLGPNALYRNKGDGTFEDKTQEAGVALGDRICVAAVFADYDNDGKQDLFVTSVRGGNVLFRNEGNGKFKDVTKEAGLEHVGHCQSAHFFDFDNDGHLDLLVTCTAKWTVPAFEPRLKYFPGKSSILETRWSEREFNLLYRNNGDGTFTNVTESSGLKGLGWAADAAVFDVDGDGYLDVVITNMFGRAQLYRNTGKGAFVEITKETLGKTPFGGMGVYPFDFNNDGKLDLFIVDMHSDMWMAPDSDPAKIQDKKKWQTSFGAAEEGSPLLAKYKKMDQMSFDAGPTKSDEVFFGNGFYKNLGNGHFSEISDKANLETFWPWGIACGDFDHNGYEDVFIPSGMGHPFFYWRNYLMMNQGNETFVERSRAYGIEPPPGGEYLEEKIGNVYGVRSSRAAAVADFDHDGRLDVIVNNFNDRPYYFRNKSKGGNYLAFRLTGTGKSNRDAIGAVMRLYTGSQIMTRQVNSACGYLAQSSKVLHFGLPDGTRIDKIEITWPSGRRQEIAVPALNALHEVTEPKG